MGNRNKESVSQYAIFVNIILINLPIGMQEETNGELERVLCFVVFWRLLFCDVTGWSTLFESV